MQHLEKTNDRCRSLAGSRKVRVQWEKDRAKAEKQRGNVVERYTFHKNLKLAIFEDKKGNIAAVDFSIRDCGVATMSNDKLTRGVYVLSVSIVLAALILAGGGVVLVSRLPETPEPRRFEFIATDEGYRIDHKNGNIVFYARHNYAIPECK